MVGYFSPVEAKRNCFIAILKRGLQTAVCNPRYVVRCRIYRLCEWLSLAGFSVLLRVR